MSRYTRRPKLEEEVCIHVVSRVVQKRRLVEDEGKAEMRRILDTQAAFAGVQVITFCFMENHFHVLLRIDPKTAVKAVSDEELVERFRRLYGSKRSRSLGLDAEMLEALLKLEGKRADDLRTRLKARMGDVSVFMREFKTRFTKWYNENHQSVGTFWAERFRSVLVEPGSPALRAVAAYIDLNPVRAGLVEDPCRYRFCGLGAAASGDRKQRAAYGWLARRLPARTVALASAGQGTANALEVVFRAYTAHIERMLEAETGLTALRMPNPEDPEDRQRSLAARLLCAGGALGGRKWVQAFCECRGVLGFLRDHAPKEFPVEDGTVLHAARRWMT